MAKMKKPKVTTDDLGIAIRDALALLDGVQAAKGHPGPYAIACVEDQDPSNLGILMGTGECFRISIVRRDPPRS